MDDNDEPERLREEAEYDQTAGAFLVTLLFIFPIALAICLIVRGVLP